MTLRPPERLVLGAYSGYVATTSLWPLLHYRSFEAVSGRKRDDWLVKTVSLLLLPSVLIAVLATRRGSASTDARRAMIGSSLALGGSSAWYGPRGRISRVYLADAAVEAVLVAALLLARRDED